MDYLITSGGVQVSNIIDIRVIRQMTAGNTTAEIIVSSSGGRNQFGGLPVLTESTLLTIYASKTNVDTANPLHRLGTFVVNNFEVSPDARTIKYVCTDKTFQMLNRIYVADETDTVDELVYNVVQRINQNGVDQNSVVTNIDSTRSDGSAFPSVSIFSAKKTAYDQISELSATSVTGDNRPYIFYYDENEQFHWVYPGNTTTGSISYGSQGIVDMKFSKKETDIVNMVIYDAGEDKNGNSILGFYLKPDAGSIKGRMHYEPMVTISQYEKEALGDTAYAAISNEDFIALCDAKAQARSETIVYNYSRGLWEATVNVRGNRYDIAGLYALDAVDFGFPQNNLRLERITHTLNKDGWQTTLGYVQDPDELTNI